MERLISKDHTQQNAITFPCMYLQGRKREMLAKRQKSLFIEVAEVTKTVFTGPSLQNQNSSSIAATKRTRKLYWVVG